MPLSDLQQQAQTLRLAAETALARRLSTSADLDDDRRCAQPTQNLVAAVTPQRWSTIQAQLGGGNGGELKNTGGHRPKFCSAFSSCALAVNSFAPFVDDGRQLPLPGVGSFSGPVRFEAQRSAGVRGYKPNLDLVVEPATSDWLFAESKCLEYLRPHTTDFSDAFVTQADKLLAHETAAFYKRFKQAKTDDQHHYELLDAEQLLKHFLAAKVASDHQRAVTLTYLYWEPVDADEHEVFAAHRREAADLAAVLVDDEVRLVPLSYPQLWSSWETSGDDVLATHAASLRERYEVAVGAGAPPLMSQAVDLATETARCAKR